MTMNIAHQLSNQPAQQLPIYDATSLTDGGSLANIQLGEQVYTLRITRAGKLILTK